MVSYGYDALDVDVGTYDAWWWNHPPMYMEKGLYRPYCEMVKKVVDVPVLCAETMDNPQMAALAVAKQVNAILSVWAVRFWLIRIMSTSCAAVLVMKSVRVFPVRRASMGRIRNIP